MAQGRPTIRTLCSLPLALDFIPRQPITTDYILLPTIGDLSQDSKEEVTPEGAGEKTLHRQQEAEPATEQAEVEVSKGMQT